MSEKMIEAVKVIELLRHQLEVCERRIRDYQADGGEDTAYLEGKRTAVREAIEALVMEFNIVQFQQFPCTYELDDDGEATGNVAFYCSTNCRAMANPDFESHEDGDCELPDHDYECEGCGNTLFGVTWDDMEHYRDQKEA